MGTVTGFRGVGVFGDGAARGTSAGPLGWTVEGDLVSNADIRVSLPDDMRDAAARRAEALGIGIDVFVATAVAARLGAAAEAEAEAERYFSARGSRTTRECAKALLRRLGAPEFLRDNERLDGNDE